MSKLVVVTGVTGRQGLSVARTFLNTPGWKVRGTTRRASTSTATALTGEGVEVLETSLDDTEALKQAFEGATAIFANTDYFQHLFPALGSEHNEPLQHASTREIEQGTKIAEAAASSSVMQTLERFIFSALPHYGKLSTGKYKNVYHFDSKQATIDVISERHPELAKKMSLLHLGHYVENWKTAPFMAPMKQEDGSFVVKRPFKADWPVPWVVASQDTGPYVKALIDLPAGQNVVAISEYMTMQDWVRLWANTAGVKAVYKQVSNDELFEGFPEPLKNELGDSFSVMQELGYTGGDIDIKTLEQLGIKIPLTSMKQYIETEDWSSVL